MKPFDENGTFRPATDHDGLRRLAVRGAGVTLLSQSLGVAIQMIATVVLARLLTPEDFGLVAMVTTFSLFLQNVGFNGFTEAVLQREEIDHGLASNLFWVNAGLSLLLAIGFAAVGPLLARFYGDPRVADLSATVAVTIFFTGLSVQHLALLTRAMRFSDIAFNDILARAVSVAVSIFLAQMGWGYWALAAGTVALPLATAAGAWVLCQWIPGLPRRGVGTGPTVRFAMNTYGQFAMNYFTRNLDNLLVGWRFGSQPLGFYKKAYDLFALPAGQLSALTGVAVSTLSRLAGDPARHERYFLSALSTLAFVGMGLGAGLTLVGRDLVLLLLGSQWEESGRIFTFFGPGIGIILLYGTHGWIHLSIGRPDRWFRWGIVEFAVTGLLFLAGLRWGPAGIALAWVVSIWVLTVPALWYAGRPIHLGIATVISAVWKYVLASAMAGCASALIIRGIPSLTGASGWSGAIGRIVVVSFSFGVLYLCAVILFHRGCDPIRHVAALLHDMVPCRSFSRSSPAVPAIPRYQHERGVRPDQRKGNELVS
jgi:PST family polysaccharide transporter